LERGADRRLHGTRRALPGHRRRDLRDRVEVSPAVAAARTAAPTVPFLDLRAIVGEDAEVAEAVARVVRSGRYVGGPEVEAFERAWAGFCGTRHAVGAGNGLDALTLALLALDVGPGDEVIVPSWTFIATWLAVSRAGAKPV